MSSADPVFSFEDDHETRAEICGSILRSLPEWFGIESAVEEYVRGARDLPFIRIDIDGAAVGFCSLKVNFGINADLYVLGILKEYHGKGIGTRMIGFIEGYCREKGIPYMSVKTLSSGHPDENYAMTRKFYEKCGFVPFEEFPALWGEESPCLFMLKRVAG
ncbi:MAG: GNAT family N-acetyltransferase [Candidatus Fermentibacteraceae bacterium]|nr:GNAT family N-acetyltransferase [Candidatus Fermentibacteraceae bacterium]MBN2607846.1 GNAT family N-acetyltransferase [Candidatus Fermentibacteraceae bacterium]